MEHYLYRLAQAIKKYWDKKALNTYLGESFSYGQMAEAIEKFHILFSLCNIEKQAKIAICAKNSARWGAAYMASSTYGTVTVPILPDFTPESVAHLVNHSDSRVLFVDKDMWGKMQNNACPNLLLVLDADNWNLLYAQTDVVQKAYNSYQEEFIIRHPNGFGPKDVNYTIDNLDELCTINYTSGSTGSPKGVMLSYRNIDVVADFAQRFIPATDKDSMVSMLPMAHMYGLVVEFIYPLCNGSAIYWLGKTPTPALLLKAFSDVKPYLLITVPLVMEKIFKAKIKPKLDTPLMKCLVHIPIVNKFIFNKIRKGLESAFGGKVREFILGGAAVNPEVEKWLKKINFPYVVGYGMTEAAPLISYIGHKNFVLGSCGKAIDKDIVRIDSADPQHIVGEIQVKGPNVCMGYYKNEEATKALFTEDGFLHTGDLGIIDKDGNIFIKGRSKNMILSTNGQNIYPEEVEAVINNENYVLESVVVDRDSKLVALIYIDEEAVNSSSIDKQQLSEQIRRNANALLPSYSQIAKVELVDKPFEKTPKMSIKRFLYT